jgi:glycosyltransferase EpsD
VKKVLQLASVASIIDQFVMGHIEVLLEMGCQVAVIANFKFGNNTSLKRVKEFKQELEELGVTVYDVPIFRNPLDLRNLQAYSAVKKIMAKERFDLVHCHSPIGGVIARLAFRSFRPYAKIIYTAHGFHFYTGAPLKNWLLFYPVERFLLRFSDLVITINQEDYELAKKLCQGTCAESLKIPGVGVDTKKFKALDNSIKTRLRMKKGFRDSDFLMIYGAEFNANKNQSFLIKAMSELRQIIPQARMLLVGHGDKLEENRKLVRKLGLEKSVWLPGFRDDMAELVPICDLYLSSSIREGFGIGLAEGLVSGLPLVATDNRGHRELVKEGENGFCFKNADSTQFINCVQKIFENNKLRQNMAKASISMAENFSKFKVQQQLRSIYSEYLKSDIDLQDNE